MPVTTDASQSQAVMPGWVPGAPGLPFGPAFAPWPPQVSPPGPPPYEVAAGSQAAGSATFNLTTRHDVAQGDVLVVFASSNSAVTAATGASDASGNDYRQVVQDTARSPNLTVLAALSGFAMPAGSTLTVTFAGTATTKNVVVRGCPGMSGVLAVDQIAVADLGAGTSPGAGPTQQLFTSGEWVLLGIANGSGGGVPSTWTGGLTQGLTQGPGPFLTVADQIAQGSAPATAGAAISTSTWTAILVTLSPLPVPPPPPPAFQASLPLAGTGLPGIPGGAAFTPYPAVPWPAAAVMPGAASLASDTSITAPAVTGPGPASLTADTSITAPAGGLSAPATLAEATTLTAPPATGLAPATLATAMQVTAPPAVLSAPATLAALAAITSPSAAGLAPATLAALTAIAAPAAVTGSPAALAAAISITAPAAIRPATTTLSALASLSGATSAQDPPALLAARVSLGDAAVQQAAAVLAATIATGGALSTQQVTAALAAATVLTAAGALQGSAVVAVLAALTGDATVHAPAHGTAEAAVMRVAYAAAAQMGIPHTERGQWP